jgi:hypothetical protein
MTGRFEERQASGLRPQVQRQRTVCSQAPIDLDIVLFRTTLECDAGLSLALSPNKDTEPTGKGILI